ncbi:MAG: oligosaccharide flippase family protein [Bacteroidota bacterium]
MNRAFLTNIALLLAINVLIKPAYIFGIDRTIQNWVGKTDYGLFFAMFSLALWFQILNDFGIQNYNNRLIAQHPQLLDKMLPNVLVLKLGLAGLYLVVSFAMAYLLGYEGLALHLLLFLTGTQILAALVFYFRSNLSGLGFYRTDSLVSALDRLLLIIVLGTLFWWYPRDLFQIKWMAYAQFGTMLLTAIVTGTLVWGQLSQQRFRVQWPLLRWLLRESYPYALIILLMTIYTRVDAVMVERLVDGEEAGIYAGAYRLLDAANMIGLLFAGLLLPMFSKLLKEKRSVGPLVQAGLRMIMAGAVTLVVLLVLFRTEVMIALYDEADAYWGTVLGVLFPSFLILSGTYILGTLQLAAGSLTGLNRLFVVSIILNIGLNFWLIPIYGAAGAAATTLCTQLLVLVGEVWLSRPFLPAGQLRNDGFRILVFIVLFASAAWFLSEWLSWLWVWEFVFLGAMALTLALLLGLLPWREWRTILAERKQESL